MREYIEIHGGRALQGQVAVSGAKNAALPLLISGLLSKDSSVFQNVPLLEDISVTLRLLSSLGAKVIWEGDKVELSTPELTCTEASYSLVKSLRASFWVLGPLLARAGRACVSLPGGDAIGARPVDLHLKALETMGADITLQHGVVTASAPNGLRGAQLDLAYPSVGATHQILMTASLVPEPTTIKGAASEPEVFALAQHLIQMGAEIEGAGTSRIQILGRKNLSGAKTSVLGDRIEAATYLVAVAMCGGQINLTGIKPETLTKTIDVLESCGCNLTCSDHSISLESKTRPSAVSFETAPFPGLATDVQPLLMALMTIADGQSQICETVFESRFGHVAEFRRFGADIEIQGERALINGVKDLGGAPVEAGDIRAAAALLLMGLAAQGKTSLYEVFHLDRGYDGICEKLKSLGANLKRIECLEDQELVFGC